MAVVATVGGEYGNWQNYPTEKEIRYDYTGWFSEEEQNSGAQTSPIAGVKCSGRYCDNKQLIVSCAKTATGECEKVMNPWSATETAKFSDGSNPSQVFCTNQTLVSQIKCFGRYCDDMILDCAPLTAGYQTLSDGRETDWFSDNGERRCPEGYYLFGMACRGSYCDDIKLHCIRLQWGIEITPPPTPVPTPAPDLCLEETSTLLSQISYDDSGKTVTQLTDRDMFDYTSNKDPNALYNSNCERRGGRSVSLSYDRTCTSGGGSLMRSVIGLPRCYSKNCGSERNQGLFQTFTLDADAQQLNRENPGQTWSCTGQIGSSGGSGTGGGSGSGGGSGTGSGGGGGGAAGGTGVPSPENSPCQIASNNLNNDNSKLIIADYDIRYKMSKQKKLLLFTTKNTIVTFQSVVGYSDACQASGQSQFMRKGVLAIQCGTKNAKLDAIKPFIVNDLYACLAKTCFTGNNPQGVNSAFAAQFQKLMIRDNQIGFDMNCQVISGGSWKMSGFKVTFVGSLFVSVLLQVMVG